MSISDINMKTYLVCLIQFGFIASDVAFPVSDIIEIRQIQDDAMEHEKSNFLKTITSSFYNQSFENLQKPPNQKQENINVSVAALLVIFFAASITVILTVIVKVVQWLFKIKLILKKNQTEIESTSEDTTTKEEDLIQVHYSLQHLDNPKHNIKTVSGLVYASLQKKICPTTTVELRTTASYQKSFRNFQNLQKESDFEESLPTYNEATNDENKSADLTSPPSYV